MEHGEYDLMYRIENAYWWYLGRRHLVLNALRRALRGRTGLAGLDVGCGTGGNMAALAALGAMSGCDIAPQAVEFCRSRGLERVVVQDNPEALPFPDATFDFISTTDVLEHVPDDAAFVRDFVRVLRPGGVVIATVPAHPALWSVHDDSLHHRRRYGRDRVARLMADAGLAVETLTPANGFLLPLIMPVRWLRDRLVRGREVTSDFNLDLHPWLNAAFREVFKAEWWWIRFAPLPFGLSYLVVARKP